MWVFVSDKIRSRWLYEQGTKLPEGPMTWLRATPPAGVQHSYNDT